MPQSTPRTLIFIAIILLIAGSKSCVAQYKNLDPALAQAAKEYDRAQIEADRSALNRLVADDYLIIRGNGTLGDKKVLLAVVAGEGMKNAPYTIEAPFQRVYGNTVILGGWVHLSGTDHGKPYVQNARFADTWARRKGKWQVVFTSVVLADHP